MTPFQNPMADPTTHRITERDVAAFRQSLDRILAAQRRRATEPNYPWGDGPSVEQAFEGLVLQLIASLETSLAHPTIPDREVRALACEILLRQQYIHSDVSAQASICLGLAHRLLTNPIPCPEPPSTPTPSP